MQHNKEDNNNNYIQGSSMHYKHLSLVLLTVASASADRLHPNTFDDILPMPSLRRPGNSSASSTIWDYVPDNNGLKRICSGTQRDESLCSTIEKFGRAMQAAGTETKKELHAADQINAQKPLSIELISDEFQQIDEIILHNALPIIGNNLESLQQYLQSVRVSSESISDVLLAPILMFAQNAGSSRSDQRNITRIIMIAIQQMQEMAQRQQAMPRLRG